MQQNILKTIGQASLISRYGRKISKEKKTLNSLIWDDENGKAHIKRWLCVCVRVTCFPFNLFWWSNGDLFGI